MNDYDFTLKFVVPATISSDEITDSLYGGACDDATIGVGVPGRLALNFMREAASAKDAIKSAISDVQKSLPQAVLVEIGPDLVGLSDAGEQLKMSRQYLRKVRDKDLAKFPLPMHEGNPSLWHLYHLLEYFKQEKRKAISDNDMEVAKAAMLLNYEHQKQRVY